VRGGYYSGAEKTVLKWLPPCTAMWRALLLMMMMLLLMLMQVCQDIRGGD
jgi:hypothetical protein